MLKKILLFFMALYTLTLLPGVGWGDVAKYQYQATQGGFPLLAGFHPWYHLLANFWNDIFPFESTVAWRQNLLSAFIACAALACFYKMCRGLKVSKEVSALGTCILGVSHTFWSMAVWAESYSLFSLMWILAVGEALIYFKTKDFKHVNYSMFFLGLGMGNNLIQPFFIPALLLTSVIFVSESRHWKMWIKPISFGLLGLLPWLLRVVYAWQIDNTSFVELKRIAMDSKYESYLFWNNGLIDIVSGLCILLPLVLYQFGVYSIVLIKMKVSKPIKCFLFLLIFTIFLFCSTYLRQRALWLMIAAYIPFTFLLVMALESYVNEKGIKNVKKIFLCLLLTPLSYFCLPLLVEKFEMNFIAIEDMAMRNSTTTFFRPWKNTDRSAAEYIDEVETQLKAGDILFVDFTPYAPLHYAQQVEGRLQGIRIFNLSQLSIYLKKMPKKGTMYLGRYNSAFKNEMRAFPHWKVDVVGHLFKLSYRE